MASKEIDEVKGETSSALDRIISVATETNEVASNTQVKLVEQGCQIKKINADLDEAEAELESTENKLKYGFGFRAWFTGGKAEKSAKPKDKDKAKVRKQSLTKQEKSSPVKKAEPNYIKSENVSDDFDSKLDTIDALLDSMGNTAEKMNAELKNQAEDLEETDEKVSDVKEKTKDQSKTIRRKFNIG
mmetsp:Transcript_12422/g.18645  ORF Transcript_12422/g.18645 Transcript_12422/m.18645 type:complete len:187 (+) Transcript_12422:27-587(+)|eukprot:CAMPEP_0171453688 /NCGR_PEP_ID=MMETSP0945-20130129/1289_1 /TAXON_ID=109269 /ORGANISM="Vaucheria litorea, Strain CCMP2940" /LENGTH=186 /DNA_ID=CAMNT_0011978591 /DNA_START=27 /DNA_END=587 /DNA_ORIENTATION=-